MKTRILIHTENGSQLIGVGTSAQLKLNDDFSAHETDAFQQQFSDRTRFIAVSYDAGSFFIKNAYLENKNSGFPSVLIWVPESLYEWADDQLSLKEGIENTENYRIALDCLNDRPDIPAIEWKPRQSKEKYLEAINKLKEHIQRGDIYETNYCQEFYAEDIMLPQGAGIFNKLHSVTKVPFSFYFENDEWMIACASPERFFRKEGSRLYSQPIKGTAPRGKDPAEDENNRKMLAESEKDKAENVMIVDLVRNDLSRIAAKNSVKVDELFGIHTFPTVHQMISTISCELRPDIGISGILQALFPMGSMTGAPKISAVRLSDKYERFPRGIYSGSVGYISPGDEIIDMNVVIRTLVYDKKQQRISCGVGGAITIASDPEAEYEECKTKVGRILELFGKCQW